MSLFHKSNEPKPAAYCGVCGAALPRGYRAWQISGLTVCQHCFPDFARSQYRPYEITCGRAGR